jgi:tetratricopeptide (TPR) repeat protein
LTGVSTVANRMRFGYFISMKLFSVLAILLLAAALPPARAQQNPDDQYVGIYSQIQQADSLQSLSQLRQAMAAYVEAQTQLEKFQKIYPDWDQKIVSYRLNYLAEKISGLTALLPPLTNAPSSTEAAAVNANPSTSAADTDSQLAGLRAQVQSLQSDNATLEAKLKEAFAVQPAAVDPGELAKMQAQVQSLMKENGLLKASVAQTSATMTVTNVVETPASNSEMTNLQAQVASLQSEIQTGALEKLALENRISQLQSAAASAPAQPDNDARISELTGEVSTLRALLAVYEAQAVPYTPEEQALLKQPEPRVAANPDARKKSMNELPAGSAELVAEAQNYFAAKQYNKAEDDYQKILQHDPKNALVLGNLAAIELQQGKLDDAETHIKSALAQNPDDSYNLSILGYLKFQQQKYDDAFDALSRALKLDPQNAEIENYLGVTLSHKGLQAQAETALRKALELDPNYAAAHNNLAVIYISGQPPSPALARFHYQKALDAGQPRNPGLEKMLADKGAPVNTQ